jgi:hypothetical protein
MIVIHRAQTYNIQITLDNISWTVHRRYTEFAQFDRERFANTISGKNSLLPPKKLMGNQVRAAAS